MKKNNVTALLAVNMVVLGVVALNAYRPELEKIANNFVKLKKNKNKPTYQLEKKKVLQLAEKVIPEPQALMQEAVGKCELMVIRDNNVINRQTYNYLQNGFERLAVALPKNEVLCLPMKELNEYEALEEKVKDTIKAIPSSFRTPTKDVTLVHSIVTLALIVALNSIGFKTMMNTVKQIDFSQEAVDETIEDIEEFFVDTYDVVVTLNNHDKIIDRKVNRIMELDLSNEQKLHDIFNLNELSRAEKIDSIIALDSIDYLTKFDFFSNSGYFNTEEAVNIIINSNLTNFTNVANYIMNIEALSLDQKVDVIMNSDLTGYIRIFDFVLSCPNIDENMAYDYVLNSSIADKDELFDYLMKRDLSLDKKVWYAMQIPNLEFPTLFNDLLTYEDLNQDEVIESIMKTDLVSFNKLFSCILELDNITSSQVINYLVYFNNYYNTGYNTMELKYLINYSQNIKIFDDKDKAECFYNLLGNLSLTEKEEFIQQYYDIDVNQYIDLSLTSVDSLTAREKIILDLYSRINSEKKAYIIEHYGISEEELNEVIAGCAAEGCVSYDDIYWVANTIFNRITNPYYTNKGINPYLQFIAPGQFSVYSSGSYLAYISPTDWDHLYKKAIAEQAVTDMLYLGYNGVQHNYIEFRSWSVTDFSNNYVVAGGNRYGVFMSDDKRVMYDFFNGYQQPTQEKNLTLK